MGRSVGRTPAAGAPVGNSQSREQHLAAARTVQVVRAPANVGLLPISVHAPGAAMTLADATSTDDRHDRATGALADNVSGRVLETALAYAKGINSQQVNRFIEKSNLAKEEDFTFIVTGTNQQQ